MTDTELRAWAIACRLIGPEECRTTPDCNRKRKEVPDAR